MMPHTLVELTEKSKNEQLPPGRVKITKALKTLLEKKEFSTITTAEIAKTAGVTEELCDFVFQGIACKDN